MVVSSTSFYDLRIDGIWFGELTRNLILLAFCESSRFAVRDMTTERIVEMKIVES